MAQTMFVPALTEISSSLNSDPEAMQGIMAWYLIPYGLFQFIYGPLSDRLGRKIPLLSGLVLFFIGAQVAYYANSIEQLYLGSFIQGAGTAAAGALARSIPRDLYNGKKLLEMNSIVSMAILFSPLVAPIIGGYIVGYSSWQDIYLVLSILSIIVIGVLALTFPEPLTKERRNFQPVLQSYKHVLSNKVFVIFMVSLVATLSGVAAFEAVAGILYGNTFGLSPLMISVLFVLPIPGYLLGAYYAAKLTSQKKVLQLGVFSLGLGALIILVPSLFGHNIVATVVLGSVLFFAGAGALFPTLTSLALQPFPKHAGVAGALLGGVQNLLAGMATLVMSWIPLQGQLNIGVFLSFATLVVWGLLMSLEEHHVEMPEGEESLS